MHNVRNVRYFNESKKWRIKKRTFDKHIFTQSYFFSSRNLRNFNFLCF